MVCKDCGETKQRIRYKHMSNTRWLYADENKRLWNGRSCPDCKTGVLVVKKSHKIRYCNHCKKIMKDGSYFNHPGCSAIANNSYDASDYGYNYVG